MLCIRGFEHLQRTAVGYKLCTWCIMLHFMSEYDQKFEGEEKTIQRSVLEMLLIQVGLLLRDKRIITSFESLNPSLMRKDSTVIKCKVLQK